MVISEEEMVATRGHHTLSEIISHVSSNKLFPMFHIIDGVFESLELNVIFILGSGGPHWTSLHFISAAKKNSSHTCTTVEVNLLPFHPLQEFRYETHNSKERAVRLIS